MQSKNESYFALMASAECAICYEALGSGSGSEQYETICHHIFHKGCLGIWTRRSLTCPMCRTPIPCVTDYTTPSPRIQSHICKILDALTDNTVLQRGEEGRAPAGHPNVTFGYYTTTEHQNPFIRLHDFPYNFICFRPASRDRDIKTLRCRVTEANRDQVLRVNSMVGCNIIRTHRDIPEEYINISVQDSTEHFREDERVSERDIPRRGTLDAIIRPLHYNFRDRSPVAASGVTLKAVHVRYTHIPDPTDYDFDLQL